MKKLNISITGCLGRMGRQLIKSANKKRDLKIISLTESKEINKKINKILPQTNTENAFRNTSVIIDFTTPKCTIEVLKIASKIKKKSCNWYNWFYCKTRKTY